MGNFTYPYEQKAQQLPTQGNRQYWWVTGITKTGSTLLIGPYISEDEANRMGYQQFDGEFDIHCLSTKDRSEATAMLKYRKMETGIPADDAMRKFRHKR